MNTDMNTDNIEQLTKQLEGHKQAKQVYIDSANNQVNPDVIHCYNNRILHCTTALDRLRGSTKQDRGNTNTDDKGKHTPLHSHTDTLIELNRTTVPTDTLARDNQVTAEEALQQLSDARVSLYRAYHLGIDIDIAEEALITAIEQYNAIHGI